MEQVEGAVAIDIHERRLSSALQIVNTVRDEPMAAGNCTIFRVPAHVRRDNNHLYEPRLVAIGPYGRRYEPSLRAMEWIKLRYLQSFCSRNGNGSIDNYRAKIRDLEPQARRCYFEHVELSAEKFVEMLLLDGCFIIEFLIKWHEGAQDDLFAADWSLPLIRGDLLLLENQIPLFVLNKLFEPVTFTDGDDEVPSSLKELLVKYLTAMSVESPEEELIESSNGPGVAVRGELSNFHHLLHLYYRCYVATPQTDPTESTICGTILKWLRPSRILTKLLPGPAYKKRSPRTIPSATELLEAGVAIKKKKNANGTQERLSAFLDVAFEDGVLEIPFLSVEPSTLPRFSNLVAFEQCGGCDPKEAYMTSYAVFMNCLINTREDVAVLHKRGILENKLGSDKELAVFFNQLSDWVTLDHEEHYLAGLFQKVRVYCGEPWPSWRAKLVRDYFSNPWAIISLFVAALLLIHTIVQTVHTIVQTVYTIYAYYHPSNPSLSSWELAA